MSLGLLGQYVMNGVMLGMMYALVAVGFTLFFGVLDIIQFSHGDVLAFGAFVALAVWAGLVKLGIAPPAVQLAAVVVVSALATAAVGALVARFVVLPLKGAPSLNVLLVTLMMGTVLREAIRLFYPGGSQPQRFPALLPTTGYDLGGFDLGSALAAFAGAMDGLYYNEVYYGMGLLLGVIGFASAIIGGLGNLYGAVLGGFLFAALQTIGAVALPFASAYKDVFAFAVVIVLMAVRPTGLIGERASERV